MPLHIWQRTQEHIDDLLREFTLITQDAEARGATPGRLLSLVQELSAGFGQFCELQRLDAVSPAGCCPRARPRNFKLPSMGGRRRVIGLGTALV